MKESSSERTQPTSGFDFDEALTRAGHFRYSADEMMRGLAGVPSWVRRTRALEDRIDRFWMAVEALYAKLRRENPDPTVFAHLWRKTVERLDYAPIEKAVSDYNEWFPIEANLPTDPATGVYFFRGRPFQPRRPLTPDDVLERFPPA